MRIGIHTGETLVGKIGAPGRVKYTLVGYSANAAAWLAQLCEEIGTLAEVKIMISSDSDALTADKTVLRNAGHNDIHGRDGDIDV